MLATLREFHNWFMIGIHFCIGTCVIISGARVCFGDGDGRYIDGTAKVNNSAWNCSNWNIIMVSDQVTPSLLFLISYVLPLFRFHSTSDLKKRFKEFLMVIAFFADILNFQWVFSYHMYSFSAAIFTKSNFLGLFHLTSPHHSYFYYPYKYHSILSSF